MGARKPFSPSGISIPRENEGRRGLPRRTYGREARFRSPAAHTAYSRATRALLHFGVQGVHPAVDLDRKPERLAA